MIDESFLWQRQSSWILCVSWQKKTEMLGLVGKPENIEPMEVGSHCVRTRKNEMTEAQEGGWFCPKLHRARTHASLSLTPWCISQRTSTDLPCVSWRQIGQIIESLYVLYLNHWSELEISFSLMLQDWDCVWAWDILSLKISSSSVTSFPGVVLTCDGGSVGASGQWRQLYR